MKRQQHAPSSAPTRNPPFPVPEPLHVYAERPHESPPCMDLKREKGGPQALSGTQQQHNMTCILATGHSKKVGGQGDSA
eukprot:scaffold54991_cov20-Tisochrysis_lutea.AAC.3